MFNVTRQNPRNGVVFFNNFLVFFVHVFLRKMCIFNNIFRARNALTLFSSSKLLSSERGMSPSCTPLHFGHRHVVLLIISSSFSYLSTFRARESPDTACRRGALAAGPLANMYCSISTNFHWIMLLFVGRRVQFFYILYSIFNIEFCIHIFSLIPLLLVATDLNRHRLIPCFACRG